MKTILPYVLLIATLLPIGSIAQGCSDAGFCTLHYREIVPKEGLHQPVNRLVIESGYNIGENNADILALSVEYGWQISRHLRWNNKITTANIHGDFGNHFNIGDLYSTISFPIDKQHPNRLLLLTGIKLPLTRSNDKLQGQSLPMVYQTSLGTYDLVAGGSVLLSRWDLQFAAQIPVINQNKNSFLAAFSSKPGYLNTNAFRRKPDVLLRIGYPLHKGLWTLNPNLLGIYHLGQDSYVDQTGQRVAINGSDGFTLNANLQANYQITQKQSLQLSLATPLIVRENRPDGLTRSFVASVAYSFGW